jgi:hypothetical protein
MVELGFEGLERATLLWPERVLLLFADRAVDIRDGLLGSRGDIGLQLLVGACVSDLDFSSMPK